MNGEQLALGIVGALAAGAALSRRGQRGSSARRSLLDFQPYAKAKPGFTASPLPFVRGYVLEEVVDPHGTGRASDDSGLYHVTTNLPAVLAHGSLLSRRQLRELGASSAGLGGGIRDQAVDMVSVGVSLSRALALLTGVRLMSDVVHGRVGNQDAFEMFQALNADVLDLLDEFASYYGPDEWAGEVDDPEPMEVADFRVNRKRDEDDILVAERGPELYRALTRWEGWIAHYWARWSENGWIESPSCVSPIGFTEPAHKFERVRTENVGLLKLAAKRGARVDMVNNECELRFRPEDLQIVAYYP